MLCDKCGKNEATVFLKQIINNKQTTQNLCQHCAEELMDIGNLSLGKFFADGIGTLFGNMQKPQHCCPVCGASYEDYNHQGLLGCSECYKTFGQQLESSIRAIHGKTTHTGKGRLPELTPKKAADPAGASLKHPEILAMQQRLNELVQAEKFEEAAIVRDQIKALSSEPAAPAADSASRQGVD